MRIPTLLLLPALGLLAQDLLAQKPGAQWAITPGITSPVPSQRRENPGAASPTHFYVFGGRSGNSGGSVLNELWSFDGKAWKIETQEGATGSPPARDRAGICWDTQNRRLVVFGGQGASAQLNDTWAFDPVSGKWADITPKVGSLPAARSWTSIAYDPASKAVILFGGLSGSTHLNDTWMLTGGVWVKLSPTTSPSVRRQHHLVTRPDFGDVLLVAGQDASVTTTAKWRTDVWRFANGQWVEIKPTNAMLPAAVVANDATYDELRQRVVMCGGNGINGGSPTGEISEFDCVSNEWVVRWGVSTPDPVLGQVSRYFMAYVSSLQKTFKISGQKPNAAGQSWLVTLEYQSVVPPTGTVGSAGCSGPAGVPTLTHTPAWLGRTLVLEVGNVPSGSATLLGIGFQSMNVPLSLLGIGSSGCVLTVNPLLVVPAARNPSGNPHLAIPLPNDPTQAGAGTALIQALVTSGGASYASNRIDISAGAL